MHDTRAAFTSRAASLQLYCVTAALFSTCSLPDTSVHLLLLPAGKFEFQVGPYDRRHRAPACAVVGSSCPHVASKRCMSVEPSLILPLKPSNQPLPPPPQADAFAASCGKAEDLKGALLVLDKENKVG